MQKSFIGRRQSWLSALDAEAYCDIFVLSEIDAAPRRTVTRLRKPNKTAFKTVLWKKTATDLLQLQDSSSRSQMDDHVMDSTLGAMTIGTWCGVVLWTCEMQAAVRYYLEFPDDA